MPSNSTSQIEPFSFHHNPVQVNYGNDMCCGFEHTHIVTIIIKFTYYYILYCIISHNRIDHIPIYGLPWWEAAAATLAGPEAEVRAALEDWMVAVVDVDSTGHFPPTTNFCMDSWVIHPPNIERS